MKKNKFYIRLLNLTLLGSLLFATPTLATTKGVGGDYIGEIGNEKQLTLQPFNQNDLLITEKITGINPVFFPSTQLDKIVQDWKVVGQQYLYSEPNIQSEPSLLLKNDTKITLLEKINDEWYKVSYNQEVIGTWESEIKKENVTFEGFISPSQVTFLNEELIKELTEKENKIINETRERLINEMKEIKRKEEVAKKLKEETRHVEVTSDYVIKKVDIIATAYTYGASSNGTGNEYNTASGKRLTRGTLAAPKDIPFGTVVELPGYGSLQVWDRGGAIRRIDNNTIRIDICLGSESEANRFGKRVFKDVTIKIPR